MKKTNASYNHIHSLLVKAGRQESIRALTVGRMLHYEDDDVDMLLLFDGSGALTKSSIIWYANKFQCLRMVDMTEEGVHKYLQLFGVCE